MGTEVMTTEHPRWREFVSTLMGPEYCNFHRNAAGNANWFCDGGEERPFARKILETMPEIDIEASFKYFEEHGGYCDCEILMNVAKQLNKFVGRNIINGNE